MEYIDYVDICCGLGWGDEAKGKVVSHLASTYKYDFVCRWAGGSNAGHTIYIDGIKYKTHIIPCGVLHNIISIIGPDCVINKESFIKEINYLKKNGFNTDLIKISPKTHVIRDKHITDDINNYKTQGTTNNGIAPCYKDKYARKGVQVQHIDFFKEYLWDEKLFGKILCEGAQGFWLDINQGNYPYVTSSTTLPYGACSIGFPPRFIRNIYGACKIYDTRVGFDPEFPETLLNDIELLSIIKIGSEYGTTTGRIRKVNWLNMGKLVKSINISGSSIIIISKTDVLEKANVFKIILDNETKKFDTIIDMKKFINDYLNVKCPFIEKIIYSDNKESINIS